MSRVTVVWYEHDLRVDDHLPLIEADARGVVVPVFILTDQTLAEVCPGAASRWWLAGALADLQRQLYDMGLSLVLRQGDAVEQLLDICQSCGADAVYWHRRYEPALAERDRGVGDALASAGIAGRSFAGCLLYEPSEVLTGKQTPYRVFTPFWRMCSQLPAPLRPLPSPRSIRGDTESLAGLSLDQLCLVGGVGWESKLAGHWQVTASAGRVRSEQFADELVGRYAEDRDLPAVEGTSRLSAWLHFGQLSVRRWWWQLSARIDEPGVVSYLRQLGWREFAYYLLHHFPQTVDRSLDGRFDALGWSTNHELLAAWRAGRTGFPIIDAGMRELWQTGWMHNRVRMLVGSFLTKDLLVDWRVGAAWFNDTLVDADVANNTMGWQWVAGCGADAAPFFRIFNPTLQSRRFDGHGAYLRRWLPELAGLSDQYIHAPAEAPASVLREAGVRLGRDYPLPMIDHGDARDRALSGWAQVRAMDRSS